MVVYSNIHDKFASTNLTYNIQSKRINLKIYMEQFQKLFLWRGLPRTSFFCLLMLLLVLNLLPQYLQTNIWQLCCQILYWIGVNPLLLLCALSPLYSLEKHIKFLVFSTIITILDHMKE